jgi:hypothetical protein
MQVLHEPIEAHQARKLLRREPDVLLEQVDDVLG